MKPINPPSVMEGRTPEQNIQSLKGWGYEIASELTFQIQTLESTIEELSAEIEKLKEAQNGI